MAAAGRADNLLREIAAPLDLSRDTLLVTSDHGQIDQGGHGGPDPVTLLEPFVLVGTGVKPGPAGDVQMVDVAPTLATLLGANLPATGQGRPRSEMLALNPEHAAQLDKALVAQQAQMVNAYLTAIGHPTLSSPTDSAAYQTTLEAATAARLSQERSRRAPLVLILCLLPLVFFLIQRSRAIVWWIGGALLYIVLFNLRYTLLDHYIYSFSSISSPTGLVIYLAVTSLLAMTIAWALTLAFSGGFRQGGRRAAEATLCLTFITLYGLSLPVAWSLALNGFTATWTLPEFASLFVALLSSVQIVVAGICGVVLSGLAALLGVWLRPARLNAP